MQEPSVSGRDRTQRGCSKCWFLGETTGDNGPGVSSCGGGQLLTEGQSKRGSLHELSVKTASASIVNLLFLALHALRKRLKTSIVASIFA